MRTIKCTMCGKEIEIPNKGNNQKYCSDCRETVKKNYKRLQMKRERAWKNEDGLETLDSLENVAICLSCTMKECHMQSAGCKRVIFSESMERKRSIDAGQETMLDLM